MLITAGNYSSASTLSLSGQSFLIGTGATQPNFTRTTDGEVVTVTPGSNVTLENVEISGATGTAQGGIYCSDDTTTLNLNGVTLDENVNAGLYASGCTIVAKKTVFDSNQGDGASLSNAIGTFDACTVSANTQERLRLDSGVFTVTNSFITRNGSNTVLPALNISATEQGTHVEFNTIADNVGVGFNCAIGVETQAPNNLFARNGGVATEGSGCTYPSSIIVGTDITALHFKSPDTAPYDYHLGVGSMAIDMGIISTIDHDFDGDHRPQGAGYDVGADEAQ